MLLLVGRPNVGKSTLFNRLTQSHEAIVSDIAGTTINLKQGTINWNGKDIQLADLVGLPIPKSWPDYRQIMQQVEEAAARAQGVLFVIDIREGLTKDDIELLNLIRTWNKPVILIANKADNASQVLVDMPGGMEAHFTISGLHGKGLPELLDYLEKFSEKMGESPEKKIAFIGRQNVGKSTLFNRLIKADRSLVSNIPGTTRDAIHEATRIGSISFELIDTAGVRRRGKITSEIEKKAVSLTKKIIRQADKIICIIDAGEGPTRQDMHLVEEARLQKKPTLVVVNKWDIIAKEITQEDQESSRRVLTGRFPWLKNYEIVTISAKEGWEINRLTDWLRR